MKGLVWLRTDLRMDDNPALRNAFIECDEIVCLYFYSSKQLDLHSEANVKVDFLKRNLGNLQSNLKNVNVNLWIVDSIGFDGEANKLKEIVELNNIDKVYANSQFGIDENVRDEGVRSSLSKISVDYQSFNDQIIYEPGFLKTGQGNPFSVFTPFKRRWVENFDIKFLDIDFNYVTKDKNAFSNEPELSDLNFNVTHDVDMSIWPEGESAALERLKDFLNSKAERYSEDRNDPIIDGTSRISPYLALGIISSKRCILEALKLNNFEFTSGNKGYTKWIDEIVWREFYRNIMHSFPKVSKGMPFQDYTKKIIWRFDQDEFDAWKNGMTGFPIIDAAMRQLKNEGWMHNRLRMVAAMFFTKNMLHDWRLGEKFFMESLIDGDFASNNGGWQWSSSTGTDAAPYFRIFNPITQSTNFDKAGDFIRKYVPELKDLDQKVIHDPSNSLRNHLGYPETILDLKQSRLRAIEAFKESRE
jgi:deoxyribodipyrimidine photo-lyase